VLGLIYIFITAKPISVRRLCLLFVLALISASGILSIFHLKGALSHPLVIATSLVLLAWGFPLVQMVRDTIRLRTLSIDALAPVSDVVRWTYGFALVAVPTCAAACLLNLGHRLVLGALPQLMTMAGLAGLALQVRFDLWQRGVHPVKLRAMKNSSTTRHASPSRGRC
jgi:hypothetical protein